MLDNLTHHSCAVTLMELRFWSFFYNFTGVVVGLLAAFFVIRAFGIVAIEMVLTLIKSYIMIGVSVFVLAFAAFRGTASISDRFLSMTIGVGLELFMLYLIIGAGMVLAPQWAELINQTSMLNFSVPVIIAFAAVLYGTVATRIPAFFGGLASGSVNMSFQDVMSAASSGVRTAMNVGAGSVVGGSMGATTVRAAIGNAQASGGGFGGAMMGSLRAAGTTGSALAGVAVPRLNRAKENVERSQK